MLLGSQITQRTDKYLPSVETYGWRLKIQLVEKSNAPDIVHCGDEFPKASSPDEMFQQAFSDPDNQQLTSLGRNASHAEICVRAFAPMGQVRIEDWRPRGSHHAFGRSAPLVFQND
ncbi:MAG: hypothetical protein KC776_19635 [Myxococcales bacterium]|nr:hypothetical protein [Myxococcales bacterium]MCB9577576.1 hypothetical protein [Polyangiaceae bacterium]